MLGEETNLSHGLGSRICEASDALGTFTGLLHNVVGAQGGGLLTVKRVERQIGRQLDKIFSWYWQDNKVL